jgi:hypothetical protein
MGAKIAAWVRRRPRRSAFAAALVALVTAIFAYSEYVGAPAVIYRGGLFYFSMRPDAPWLSRSIRLALEDQVPEAQPGELTWRQLAPGIETGDLPVLVGHEEIDRLYFTRIDPSLYKFELRVNPRNGLDDWMRELQPVALINGSYYSAEYGPATPVIIDGTASGPTDYQATHGAFISTQESASLIDLSNTDWHSIGSDAETMFVSYPTLLDESGSNRASPSRWLASRSFIAQDAEGFIILGSAPEGFFSLYRLGEFLKRVPINWRYVLNLDGGPVACHGVSVAGVSRRIYGHVELQSDGVNAPLRVLPTSRTIHAVMPIVIAVFPRSQPKN